MTTHSTTGVISFYTGSSIVFENNITYYYLDELENGSVLYTSDTFAGEDSANGLDNEKVFLNDGNGIVDFISTTNNGVVSIVYGNLIVLNNNTYYYAGTFDNGNTLFSDMSMDTVADGLNVTNQDVTGDETADTITTDNNGVITIIAGTPPNSITLNGTTYYYATEDAFEDGTVLYTDSPLATLAANLNITTDDVNNDTIADTVVTDGSGVVTITLGT